MMPISVTLLHRADDARQGSESKLPNTAAVGLVEHDGRMLGVEYSVMVGCLVVVLLAFVVDCRVDDKKIVTDDPFVV